MKSHDFPSTCSSPVTLTEARSEFRYCHRFTFLPWRGNMSGDSIKLGRSPYTRTPDWEPSMFLSASIVLRKSRCLPCTHPPKNEEQRMADAKTSSSMKYATAFTLISSAKGKVFSNHLITMCFTSHCRVAPHLPMIQRRVSFNASHLALVSYSSVSRGQHGFPADRSFSATTECHL